MAVLFDFWYFLVEFFEGDGHFDGDVPGCLDVGVWLEEESHHEVLGMDEVDEIVLVVVVDCSDFRVCLGLNAARDTFSRLLCACLMALINMEVACTNFSFSFWGTLWQIRIPSLSDSTIPLRQWNSSTIRFRNSVLSPPIQ